MESPAPYYCSTLDSIWPPVIQSWVLCFSCDTSKSHIISKILMAGFAKTIQQKPYLAGRLDREYAGPRSGRIKLTYPYKKEDTPIWVNGLTGKQNIWLLSNDELRRQGTPISYLKPEILEPPGGYRKLASLPISAQINFIPGGCLLYICLNHSLFDGLGGSTIVGAWAENCKDLQQHTSLDAEADSELWDLSPIQLSVSESTGPFQLLSLPKILQDNTAPNAEEAAVILQDRSLWHLLGLQKPSKNPPGLVLNLPSSKVMVSAIFATSEGSIARLKAASTPFDDDEGAPPYVSSFDAIAALLWRCIMRARLADLGEPGKTSSRLRIPLTLRQTLGIPDDHLGNTLLNSVTEIPLDSLVSQTDGRLIAPKIRSSIIFSRDAHRALNAIKLSFILPEFDSRRPLFSETTAQDLVLTSWQELPYYKHDWGPMFGSSGTAESFRIPHGYLRGICALQPRRSDNTMEVLVNLERGQMDKLINDVEFKSYFKLKSM